MDGTFDLEVDPQTHVLMEYKRENEEDVAKINHCGRDGEHLSIEAPKLKACRTRCIGKSKYCWSELLFMLMLVVLPTATIGLYLKKEKIEKK